ncbi:MAG TPA: hypothetical protein PLO89_07835 [Spirochaetota bacterium]|nr:hypothetical protein [Spirochaetota bacterium]
MKRIGELLIENSLLTKENLDKALDIQKTNGKHIGEILIDMKLITYDILIEYLDLQIKSSSSSML